MSEIWDLYNEQLSEVRKQVAGEKFNDILNKMAAQR